MWRPRTALAAGRGDAWGGRGAGGGEQGRSSALDVGRGDREGERGGGLQELEAGPAGPWGQEAGCAGAWERGAGQGQAEVVEEGHRAGARVATC